VPALFSSSAKDRPADHSASAIVERAKWAGSQRLLANEKIPHVIDAFYGEAASIQAKMNLRYFWNQP
jgi:hypothetical protein